MTAPEILKRATLDMATIPRPGSALGSIEKGKLADFFLVPGDPTKDLKAIKTIAMVVKDGVFYFPSEVYPKFGIEPFAAAPKVTLPTITRRPCIHEPAYFCGQPSDQHEHDRALMKRPIATHIEYLAVGALVGGTFVYTVWHAVASILHG